MSNVFSLNQKSKEFMSDMDWALTMTFDKNHIKNSLNTVSIHKADLIMQKIEKQLDMMTDYSAAKQFLNKFSVNHR